MRKTICALLLVTIMFVTAIGTFAYEEDSAECTQVILSNLTDEECVSFLKNAGVVFPYDEDDWSLWGPIVKEMISLVETNPAHIFVYNFSKTQELANNIKAVVNAYYGINTAALCSSSAYTSDNQLLYSTRAGSWTDDYYDFNCYGYAIGTHNTFEDPGFHSGQQLLKIVSVPAIANLVKADLEALGYDDVQVWSAEDEPPICSICVRIALRIRANVDYHFMRLDKGDDYWYHKPSHTALLKYNNDPLTGIWTNEGYIVDEYIPPSIEYNSAIYLIGYDFHSYKYMYYGADRHILTCVGCGVITGASSSCIMNGNICRICGHNSSGNQIMSLNDE